MRKLFYSCAIMALMASCSSDDEMSTVGDKFAGEVKITAEAYEFDGNTRTSLTNTGSAISFAWDDDETIGVFPIAPTTNIQAKQKLDNGSNDGLNSKFDGAGWALLRGNTYAAYYPYQNLLSETPYTAIPVDMTGQEQNGNASLAHIGEGYDYMYAVASIPTGTGSVGFDFKHIGSIVMLELTMPDAGEWKNLTLTAGSKVFISKATMNVSDGSVTATEKSESMSLALKNICTTAANQTITLYMAILPTTTDELTITVTSSEDKEYSAKFVSKTVVAGKAYKWSPSFSKAIDYGNAPDGVEAVDLGLPSGLKWANMNVGATSATDLGNYYSWGETKAWGEEDVSNVTNYSYAKTYKKTCYGWNTYKWSQGSGDTMTKYCLESSKGTVDGKKILDPEDDAATVNWGGDWRMPTCKEFEELTSNSYLEWTNSYKGSGVAGCIVYKALNDVDKGVHAYAYETSKPGYSLSLPHVFLPAAGGIGSDTPVLIGSWGLYLPSTLTKGSSYFLAYYVMTNHDFWWQGYDARADGCSVRAVCR